MADVLDALVGPRAGRLQGALLFAPLGGGKSRCLDEIADAVVGRGRIICRIHASAAGELIPFGAVAHMLPRGARESDEPVALIGALRDILAPAGSTRPVLIIDDLPSLDVTTAGVLASLAQSGAVVLVAAARTGESLPSPLVDVFLGERSLVIDLPPLADTEIATLVEAVLGGSVDGAVVVSLRDRSEGNPLFLRELIRGALQTEVLHQVSDVWRLRAALPLSTRLRDVVESRLEHSSPDERRALELLAACDSLELDELEDLVGIEPIAELESRGLITTVERSGKLTASITHPLHAEAIRVGLPAVRARLLMRQHVSWLEDHPRSTNGDALQRALWRLEAGLLPDMEQLLNGAQLASSLQDSRSVLRLARPAFDMNPTAVTAELLADACFQTGRWAEAYEMLDLADGMEATPSVRVELGMTRATIHLWGLGDAEGALAVMDRLRSDPEMSPADLTRIRATYASVLVNAGRPGEARAELESAVASGELSTELGAAVARSNSLAMAGQMVAAVETIDGALHRRPGHHLVGVADVDTHHVSKAFAMIEGGRLNEAMTLAADGYEHAVANARPLTQFWFSLLVARIHLLRGAVATALREFSSAAAMGADSGLAGPARSAMVGVVIGHALLGQSDEAAAALQRLDQLPAFGFMGPERGLADGWCAVASGDLAAARRILQESALAAEATGHITSAVWLLHDSARLGGGAEVVDSITSLAAGTDSVLAATRARHVRAWVASDVPGLVIAADAFAGIGADLLAAEVLVTASNLARSGDDQRLQRSLGTRAAYHMGRCEGATTPALRADRVLVEPLTDREREIAFLAANGMKSREIAEQLFVSLRTVSNHLQHVYDKLGVRSRDELRAALAVGDS
ncbi:MAG TPA: LuxR C-terminal-related transcriptional regulator [Ilumatobacteraceae bacterium]|nr:LuxR C-terminal-related transcriptional regulator [Ilumatobacteraceae bacterium]HRB04030.1 LuxR C-terminal-related transcriptional regulator [Ilumatobacteraceae bacterium]